MKSSGRGAIAGFAVTIFAGAFLLFLVQPLIGKYILPWFGGSSAVWTTVVLFFQVLLLAGYAYAHALTRFVPPKAQALVHTVLVAAALVALPVTPGDAWKPHDGGHATLRILGLLAASVGLPGLVVATTGPLFQSWFRVARRGASPYRLYALSNLGSLLALVSYPVLVEPVASRATQALAWSAGFVVYAIVAVACAWIARRALAVEAVASGEPVASEAILMDLPAERPGLVDRLLWLSLPAVASVLLLAFTNQLTLDVAVIPFLWVLPLCAYLLTFILAFDHPRWYVRPVFAFGVAAASAGAAWLLHDTQGKDLAVVTQVSAYVAILFVVCMFLHGELARAKPHPALLTSYYLSIAAGGALGGAFVALAAPRIFRGYFELQLGLVLACALVLVVLFHAPDSILRRGRHFWAWALFAVAFVGLSTALRATATETIEGVSLVTRGFYGVLSIAERDEGTLRERFTLSHGSTLHGLQFTDPRKRMLPTAYYGLESGVGRALRSFPAGRPLRVGAVGLGVGTIASYGRQGDVYRFYEINPEVVSIAREHFNYLSDSAAKVEIVPGDARVSLEREEPQRYDVLVLDAFSGDSIPVHLLTVEAFDIYSRHLVDDGILAIHLSNQYLDLPPVVVQLAEHLGLDYALIEDNRKSDRDAKHGPLAESDRDLGLYSSTWILIAALEGTLDAEVIRSGTSEPDEVPEGLRLWTDDSTSLFPILDY